MNRYDALLEPPKGPPAQDNLIVVNQRPRPDQSVLKTIPLAELIRSGNSNDDGPSIEPTPESLDQTEESLPNSIIGHEAVKIFARSIWNRAIEFDRRNTIQRPKWLQNLGAVQRSNSRPNE
jgi:hypothetical protein